MALGGMDKYVKGLTLFYGDTRSVLDRTVGMSDSEFIDFYENKLKTGYTVVPDTSIDGTRLGFSTRENIPFEYEVLSDDSNLPGGTYGGGNTGAANIPGSFNQQPDGTFKPQAGALNGLGQTVATVADRISLAVAGVNIGSRLGLKIDEALYEGLDRWFDIKVPALNPQTWNSLCGQSETGDFFLRVLFGITGDDMTGYISAEALAYYYQVLRDNGVYDTGGETADYDGSTSGFPYPNVTSVTIGPSTYTVDERSFSRKSEYYYSPGRVVYTQRSATSDIDGCLYSNSPGSVTEVRTIYNDDGSTRQFTNTYSLRQQTTYNGTVFYYFNTIAIRISELMTDVSANILPFNQSDYTVVRQIGTIIFDGTITSDDPVDGISKETGATQYPPTNITGTTPQQVLDQLKQEYPDLFQDAITEKVPQDDGTLKDMEYVPIPWTTGTDFDTGEATTGDGKGQTSTTIDPEIAEKIIPTTPQDEQTQPPDTGEGSTPIPPIPTGSASSLWAVYNPSQGELNSFGAWLWSSDFVEQLKKLFADPMQAIIGVHKVFAAPHTGGSQTIKCGYLDSGVSASVVTSQYTTVDCGSASLREYFGNVFDYDPFTKVSIFLPFIGIVPLNTADVMRSTISVKYKVDVITGACLAEVNISRDGGGGILYTYGGSAIVTYPVSSGSYVGAVQAALSTAIGIGSAIATGGASLGASTGMVLGGLSHAKTQVQHSGQFSGSSGAMGGKKPYLIVSRPQTRTPSKIGEYKGIPSNAIHKLSSCTGFVKVNEVHIKSKTAYDNEIQEIESLLKSGVII